VRCTLIEPVFKKVAYSESFNTKFHEENTKFHRDIINSLHLLYVSYLIKIQNNSAMCETLVI